MKDKIVNGTVSAATETWICPISKTSTVAQKTERLATGWNTEGSKFESQESKEVSLLQNIQTASGAHLAFYCEFFHADKAAGTWT
jgi:hypothetical protein